MITKKQKKLKYGKTFFSYTSALQSTAVKTKKIPTGITFDSNEKAEVSMFCGGTTWCQLTGPQ